MFAVNFELPTASQVTQVHDYDDKRQKKAEAQKEPAKTSAKNLLIDLPSGLRKKCQRAEPGKGGEITLLQTEAAILFNVFIRPR